MDKLHELLTKLLTNLGEVRTAIIEVTSTLSIAIICFRILWDKLGRKK